MYRFRHIAFLLIVLLLWGCGEKAPPVSLNIISGSENKSLEPMIQSFAQANNMNVNISYKGSVDIMLGLEQGQGLPYDAVWPANSLWLRMGDTRRVTKHEKSIMRSPIAFGVKKSVAQKLGWIGKDVRVADILTAAENGELRFAMTSATQSNSGASAYLGFLHAMAGSPDVLNATHLEDTTIQDQVRRLLHTVNRSSGSSGWLKDMFLEHYFRYDAMVNYEALIIEANQALVTQGKEPLYAIYPVDGLMVANSPLAYVDKGSAEKEQAFLKLQEHLSSPESRAAIGQMGRRSGLVGLSVDNPNPAVFNPDWGIDTKRVIAPIPLPAEAVFREALSLYQTSLRKPSLTVYVLDYSGSMRGEGIAALREAMETLLEPELAKRYMLQSSAKDQHIVVPFNGEVIDTWKASGNDPQTLRQLLRQVLQQQEGGGTHIYKATTEAFRQIAAYEEQLTDFFPAVILMTDGRSEGGVAPMLDQLKQYPFYRDIPVFSITFGDADESQLQDIVKHMDGRVFNGRKNLVDTFRKAKGYN